MRAGNGAGSTVRPWADGGYTCMKPFANDAHTHAHISQPVGPSVTGLHTDWAHRHGLSVLLRSNDCLPLSPPSPLHLTPASQHQASPGTEVGVSGEEASGSSHQLSLPELRLNQQWECSLRGLGHTILQPHRTPTLSPEASPGIGAASQAVVNL